MSEPPPQLEPSFGWHEWAAFVALALPLLSVIEYFVTMKLIEMGYCTPCVCRFCPSFHLHGQVVEEDEDGKGDGGEPKSGASSSFADMRGVPFVDAEAGEAAPASEGDDEQPIQRVNTYKRKKRNSLQGGTGVGAEGVSKAQDEAATDDADAKPLAKAPSRLSFSGMNPFGRRKSEELKTPPDVDA